MFSARVHFAHLCISHVYQILSIPYAEFDDSFVPRMYLIEIHVIIILVNRNCVLKNLSYQLQKGTVVMYIFEDAASNTHEAFSGNYVDAHLRGTHNRYFAHMCHCQFTTHLLEIEELNKKFDNALLESGIDELSINVTYDVVFNDQRSYFFTEYTDIDSTEFAYSHSDIIDLQITSFVRNHQSYEYDYTELLSSIRDYLEETCHSSSIVYSVFTQRFRPEPTLRSKYTIEDLYTTGEQ